MHRRYCFGEYFHNTTLTSWRAGTTFIYKVSTESPEPCCIPATYLPTHLHSFLVLSLHHRPEQPLTQHFLLPHHCPFTALPQPKTHPSRTCHISVTASSQPPIHLFNCFLSPTLPSSACSLSETRQMTLRAAFTPFLLTIYASRGKPRHGDSGRMLRMNGGSESAVPLV